MDTTQDRRAAPRHDIQVEANLSSGDRLPAGAGKTRNVSREGVLIELPDGGVEVGQSVECELAVDGSPDALPAWAAGEVVRVEEKAAAVRFKAGVFAPDGEAK
jgi:hypothetical protein